MSIGFIYPAYLWLLILVPMMCWIALTGPKRPTRRRFWLVLAVRIISVILIVMALGGVQFRLSTNQLTVVFLLDKSDSLPGGETTRGEEIIRQAISEMPAGDQAAVVVFGEDALVDRLVTDENTLIGLTSIPATARTDLEGALQLGMALFPEEGAKRLVLLSDGRENIGEALKKIDLAVLHQIELVFIPLHGPEGEQEVLVASLDAPMHTREGEGINLDVVVESTDLTSGALRIFDGDQTAATQEVVLQKGTNHFSVLVTADRPGFRRFQAQIVPDSDTRLQNNQASAFTIVQGPPQVLIVETADEEGEILAAALQANGMFVNRIRPEAFPTNLTTLSVYDTVVLVNTPADALPGAAATLLPVFVQDLGRGLVMTGGQSGFGAGGYLRTSIEELLPVYMDTRAREESANLALVLVVDKSGSMGRCHCDDPNLAQSYTRVEVGQPKVDIAKAAVLSAASALTSQDYLGVVAFDAAASWVYNISHVGDYVTLEGAIGGIQANGQTNLQSGVQAAFNALENIEARRKHIILLTDGWSQTGDITPLVDSYGDAGITFSVVAAGGGSAEYLEKLAVDGAGRYYPAEDILRVPEFFLKETVTAVGEYIIEEPFYPVPSLPGPVLKNLDVTLLPPLLGYNGTSPKGTARIDLATPKGDPLLATWHAGLGKTAAWTSDIKGQWGIAWVNWEDFVIFAGQLVGWTLPDPSLEGVNIKTYDDQGHGVIDVEVLDEAGNPWNFLDITATVVLPDLNSEEISLNQIGPGQYEGRVDASNPGTYLVNLSILNKGAPIGQQQHGFVIPYSPEYLKSGTNFPFLTELAARTGGGELIEPGDAFLHDLPAASLAKEIWRPLLFLAVFLFPIDVALRRIVLGRDDISSAVQWLLERTRRRGDGQENKPRAMGHLFAARDNVRTIQEKRSNVFLEKQNVSLEEPQQSNEQKGEQHNSEEPSVDMLTRLKAAKKMVKDGEKQEK